MSTQTIDYDALAKQAGALDYDELAKQAGSVGSTAPAKPGFGSGYRSGLGLPGPVSDLWSGVKELATHPLYSGKLLAERIAQGQVEAANNAGRGTSPVIDALRDKNYPNAAGQIAGAATGGALVGKFGTDSAYGPGSTGAGKVISATAPRIGSAALAGLKAGAEHIPIVGPITKAALTAAIKNWQAGGPHPADALTEPAESVFPETGQLEPENAEPSLLEQSKAKFAEQQPAKSEAPAYPTGLQKRPTDRAEITSDKAVEDAMRNNLEKQGWQALSQERKEFYANNQPGMSKGDLVTNARVEAVRTAAEQEVQKILAESNRPIRFTKTVIPKAKTAAAQPVATGDPNTDMVDILQRSIDAINARKGK